MDLFGKKKIKMIEILNEKCISQAMCIEELETKNKTLNHINDEINPILVSLNHIKLFIKLRYVHESLTCSNRKFY